MNEERKELEELFEEAEMAAKEKDLMQYYKKRYMNSYPSERVNGVDYEGGRNRVMDVLKEVLGVKTAHATNYFAPIGGLLSKRDSNCEAEFDGENLNLYKDGKLLSSMKAMSGLPEYQKKEYQSLEGAGPIPDGTYYINKNLVDKYGVRDWLKDMFTSETNWSGGEDAWGNIRYWLDPDPKTDTMDRDGFSIHGGKNFGSAGCIDLEKNIEPFMNQVNKCERGRIPVRVKLSDKFN